VVYFCLPIV